MTFTENQINILKSLKLLGLTYIAKDKDNTVTAYSTMPHRSIYDDWRLYSTNERYLILDEDIYSEIFNLVYWEDEPLNI